MNADAVFIDSNIWLYALVESDDPMHKIAKEMIQRVEMTVVSSQVISEVCVNLLRTARQTEKFVQELIFSFYSKYEVVSLDEALLLKASELRGKYSLSYWDSMIVAAALDASCSVLYSEDMQSGQMIEQRMRIVNPLMLGS